MAKIKIDKEKCLGCGTCVSLCGACFKIGEDGKAEVKKDACSEKDCNLEEVVSSCPVGAIHYNSQ